MILAQGTGAGLAVADSVLHLLAKAGKPASGWRWLLGALPVSDDYGDD